MKKIVVLLMMLSTFFFQLTSCSHIRKYDSCHPVNHPMSKWEGDAEGLHFELYIGDEEHRDFMVVDYGNKKIFYLVWWHRDYASQMSIRDKREFIGDVEHSYTNTHQAISYWNIDLVKEDCFKMSGHEGQGTIGECKIPELMLPNEVTMTRVLEGLFENDFPQIEQDDSYKFCPIYRRGTQWVSDDNQFEICIDTKPHSNDDISEVVFTADQNAKFFVKFFEVESKAYLIKQENESAKFFTKYSFTSATEEWKCEYFEDYFLATVIRSEYYEPEHILTFTLLPSSTESETNFTTETTTQESTPS